MSAAYQTSGTIFEQIADSIELAILEGKHPADSRIESVREAASQMGVNVNTVVRSYNLLEERGVVRKERGLGYFIARGAAEGILQRRRKEFFSSTLPHLLQTMRRLQIDIAELEDAIRGDVQT